MHSVAHLLPQPATEACTEHVRAIARSLVGRSDMLPADRALFWAHAARYIDDLTAEAELVDSVEQLAGSMLRLGDDFHSLLVGKAGRGWVLMHVLDDQSDAWLAPFDEQLYATLTRSAWGGAYDFIYGLAGITTYVHARWTAGRRDFGVACAREIFRHLRGLAAIDDVANWWEMNRKSRSSTTETAAESACTVNCGMGHGLAGIIVALSHLVEMGILGARALLGGAMSWLDQQWLSANQKNLLPDFATSDHRPAEPSITAWCRGDLGALAGLINAARRAGMSDDSYVAKARMVAARPACATKETGLCHGLMGHAHIFNRIYRATGEHVFADAAYRSAELALAQHSTDLNFGGFGRIVLTENGASRISDMSWLRGASGVALAMLGLLHDEEPGWDALLGINIPVIPKASHQA